MTDPSQGVPPAAEGPAAVAPGVPAPAGPAQAPAPTEPAAPSPMPTQPGYPAQPGYPQPGPYPQQAGYPQPGPYPPGAGYPPGAPWPPPGAPAPWPGQPAPGTPVGAPAPWASAAAMASSRASSALAGLDRTGWRTTIAVALVMIGVLGGANLVNAVVPLPADPGTVSGNPGQTGGQPGTGPAQPGPVTAGQPTDVGSGVKIYAPAGWSVTQSQDGSTAFSRGSAAVIVTVGSFSGSPAELEKQYRAQFANMQFSGSAPSQATMGSGIPAVAVVYSAVLQGKTQVDGIYVVGVSNGVGVVVNALAPQGQLQPLAADINAIVDSVQVGG